MDILNFISWIRGNRVVTTVDPTKTLIPVGLKDDRRDDNYLPGAISVEDLSSQMGGSNYKVYSALLTQTGTNAPVATILENTLGVEVTWTYQDVGQYFAESTNAFPLNKTGCLIGGSASASNCPSIIANTLPPSNPLAGSVVYVQCSGAEYSPNYYTDDALLNTIIEIRVYN